MKKIAYLMPSFPVFSETFIGTEIRAMEKRGHEVCLIAFDGDYASHAQPHDQAFIGRTHYLNETPLSIVEALCSLQPQPWSVWRFLKAQQSMTALSLLHSGLKVAAIAKQAGCDHIHAHFAQSTAAVAYVASRLLSITASFVGHGHDVYEFPYDLSVKLQHCDLAVAVCADMQQDFLALYDQANVGLVYCGVELNRFSHVKQGSSSTRFQQSDGLIYVGRLAETKGIDDIIKALALIPTEQRPKVDIVGEGLCFDQLNQQVLASGLEHYIHFLGKRSSEWLGHEAMRYRAMICPFKESPQGNRDTGPVVIKEAMALGLPVITTYFMGCKEMVTAKTGLRVEPGDVVALQQAIETMMSLSEAEWLAMSEAAYQRVSELYTSDRQAKILSDYIEALS